MSEPIAGGDAPGPKMVRLAIAEPQVEKRGVTNLPQIEAADRESQCAGGRPQAIPASLLRFRIQISR